MNPITQLHQDEMVLPAHLANVVRRVAASGDRDAEAVDRATSSGGGGGGTVHQHHYHIQAIDSKSFEDALRRNPKAVAAGVQSAVRNGHLAPRST
jgi:hypothetical protein